MLSVGLSLRSVKSVRWKMDFRVQCYSAANIKGQCTVQHDSYERCSSSSNCPSSWFQDSLVQQKLQFAYLSCIVGTEFCGVWTFLLFAWYWFYSMTCALQLRNTHSNIQTPVVFRWHDCRQRAGLWTRLHQPLDTGQCKYQVASGYRIRFEEVWDQIIFTTGRTLFHFI